MPNRSKPLHGATCADPLLGSSCAPTSEEAFGGSWVPGSGEWGGASPKYAMRILGNTSHAVLCEAGSPDCPSCLTESELVFGDNGDLIRDKDNVPILSVPARRPSATRLMVSTGVIVA